MLFDAAAAITPFEWALQHIQLIGWPTVILFAWKASRFIVKVEDRALDAEKAIKAVAETNAELHEALVGQVTAQHDLANGVHQLAEAMHHQSEVHAEQLGLIREMMVKQEVLAANQTALMTGLQRVVEQLIDVVKG